MSLGSRGRLGNLLGDEFGLLLSSCSIDYEGLQPPGQVDHFNEREATKVAYAETDCAEVA